MFFLLYVYTTEREIVSVMCSGVSLTRPIALTDVFWGKSSPPPMLHLGASLSLHNIWVLPNKNKQCTPNIKELMDAHVDTSNTWKFYYIKILASDL